jgi:pyruvate/2-oxoglutarate dehydrogenase complex dihydrolipoamide acyltransferase (E2) component
MTYYFVKIPKLPKEIAHQMGTVEILEYTVKEDEAVKSGQVIAIVENWWARIALKATNSGYVSKTFFSPGAHFLIDDPFAIIVCDPENGPAGKETCTLEIIENIRKKPV